MDKSLSSRGQIAAHKVLRKDFELFFEASKNMYHSRTNPSGAITLNVAENVLSWPMLRKRVRKVMCRKDIPDWVSSYTSCLGHPGFREAVSNFFAQHLTKNEIDPSAMAISAGATATIEITSWLLCDDGDVAAFPAPCYPVYTMDIGNKAGVERYDIITHSTIKELDKGPTLNVGHLDQTYETIQKSGKNMKMLVLTSPDNPTGVIYPLKTLKRIAAWCIQRKVHLVVNEIYGLSIIKSKKARPFKSFANIITRKKSEYLHLWYSFSKDLGISGFRLGVLHSLNSSLIKAMDNYNAPHMASNLTQWVMQEVLADKKFIKKYIKKNQQNLFKSRKIVTGTLDDLGIDYVKSFGSLFIWMDMSRYLREKSKAGEDDLWKDIYNQSGILLTPGDGFGHDQSGHFRLVYSCVPRDHLKTAMQRFVRYVQSHDGSN